MSAILARLGAAVMDHPEADEDFGAVIRVTETVHVELPTEGGGAVVVKAPNGDESKFYKRRTKVKELVFDVVRAGAVVLR